MIHVVAILTAKPGQRQALLDILKSNVPAVLAEVGCIEYNAVLDIPDASPAFGPDSLVVIEKWASMGALKAHAAAPHMTAFGKKIKDILAEKAVHVLHAA